VLPTLAVHGFLDGAGLAVAFQQGEMVETSAIAIGGALVLHKIPEGLFVASLLIPSLGLRATWVRLVALSASTVFGALSGRELLAHTSDQVLHLVVALGLGVMLRMATHRHCAMPHAQPERLASGAAFVACLGALLAVPDPERLLARAQPGELNAWQALIPLLLETAPWLLASLLVGECRARWLPNEGEGERDTTAMWLPVVALSFPLLGGFFTLVRASVEPFCSAGVVAGGPIRLRLTQRWPERIRALLGWAAPRAGQVLPSYVVGVALAVAMEAVVPGDELGELGWVALPAAAVTAAFVRIGAAGVTVLCAVLVHKGLPLSAALVFALVAAYASQSRGSLRSNPLALAAMAVAVSFMYLVAPPATPSLHQLAAHQHPWLEWAAAAVITSWALLQLAMLGPRDWFPFRRTTREGVQAS